VGRREASLFYLAAWEGLRARFVDVDWRRDSLYSIIDESVLVDIQNVDLVEVVVERLPISMLVWACHRCMSWGAEHSRDIPRAQQAKNIAN
jgi:hypothetical protein